jgi:predicted MFS family arabinose efflux permease
VGVLPDIAKEYHTSLTNLGYLVTIFALVYAFTTPWLTALTNRWPRHQVLLVLMAIFLVANTWSALATNYWSLLCSRILAAAVAGTIISLVLVIANFIAPLSKRTSLLSWIFAGFNISAIIGLPIGTFISTHLNWHDSFWLISIISVIIFILLIWLVPKDTPQYPSRLRKQFNILADAEVILGLLFTVSVNAADYTFYTYIRPLITQVMNYSNNALNWILLLFGICSVTGNILGGRLTEQGGMRPLIGIYIGATITLLALGSVWAWPWLACLVCCLICILIACYGAPAQVLFMDIAEKRYPEALDFASSLCSIFANIGISLGSLTASKVVSFTSVGNVGYFAAMYSVVALVSIWTLAKRGHGRGQI